MKRAGDVAYFSFPAMEPWPELTQAAFSRFGGVSDGPFASLNISFAVEDDPAKVRENRARMARAVAWDARNIVSAYQVHGRHVAQVVTEMAGGPDLPNTDALATDEPGVLLMLKFADCVPVVLWDPVRRVVGLAHAGWRGTISRTPAALVEFMRQHYGSRPADLLAGVGPSIGPCCYQVGPEVERLAAQVFAGADVLQRMSDDDVRFDLWAANTETLMRAGLPEESISRAGICTRCSSDTFFSHRGSGGKTGRFAFVAGIRDG